jgi:hypothetical protein
MKMSDRLLGLDGSPNRRQKRHVSEVVLLVSAVRWLTKLRMLRTPLQNASGHRGIHAVSVLRGMLAWARVGLRGIRRR